MTLAGSRSSRRPGAISSAIWCVCLIAVLWADAAWSAEACMGDCDGNGVVMINDLVLGVRIALRQLPIDACRPLDANGDEQVTIEELVLAISGALSGCVPVPEATETPINSPTLTPLSCPPQTPQVDPFATEIGDPVIVVTGSVAVEHDGSSVYLCGERGCLGTGPLSGHAQHAFSIAMLLGENRVNHIGVCTQDPECASTACAETDSDGAPLTVRQIPCLSASCTPSPAPTPTCGNIFYEFCDNGHRSGTCGPCCFCEATVTATATPPNASPPSYTPTATGTPTPPVCVSQTCPDLQPVSARDFLPDPEGPCVSDLSEILPYLANVCVANNGDAPAGRFTVTTSAPAKFDSRFFQPVFEVSGLDVGAQLCRLVLLPYFDLEVNVDSANEVLERDESNNREHYPLPIPSAPRFCTVTPTSTRSTVPSVQPTPTPNPSGCAL